MGDSMSGSRGVVALGVALVAGALVLSGCNGGATPGDSGSPSVVETSKSASPSVTPSPTPTATPTAAAYKPATPEGPAENVPVPEMPAAAKENTPEGREAFIKYYFDLMNYTIEARDPSVMLKVTTKGTRYLQNLMSVSLSQAQDNTWTVDGQLELKEIAQVPTPDPNGIYNDLVIWDKKPYQYYRDGTPILEEAGGSGRQWTMSLAYVDSKWIVQGFEGPA